MWKTTYKNFRDDTRGNVALMTAVSLTVLITCVGMAMDYSFVSKNTRKTQDVADTLSLAAAVAIDRERDGGAVNKDPMFASGVTYKASSFGYDFPGLKDGTDVEVTFDYDDDNNEVRVEVRGQHKPFLTRIIGRESIDFSSASTAEYPDQELNYPASIAMVIDNSNSMWYDEDPSADWDQAHFDYWYNHYRKSNNHSTAEDKSRQVPTGSETVPAGTAQRIDSLRQAFRSLNNSLGQAIEDDKDQRYLRMGLIPFNQNFIGKSSQTMRWGTIPDSKINGMSPSGETNTAKGMDKAWNWMRNEHNKYDRDIRDDLKRYIIFMTDGHNTTDQKIQINKPGSGLWRGQVEEKRGGYMRKWRPCTRWEPRTREGGEGGTESYNVCTKRGPQRQEWVPETTRWVWRNRRQATQPSGGKGWKEIDYVDRTQYRCDQMKKQGWEIFSVGYSLQPGVYRRNIPGRPGNEFWGVSPDDVEKARELLEYCASDEDNFILADNASELEKAFDDIGDSITRDTGIRVKR